MTIIDIETVGCALKCGQILRMLDANSVNAKKQSVQGAKSIAASNEIG
jgi:hypothetical protein